MKRPKRNIGFGAWQYLGSDLLKACKESSGNSIKSSSLFAVMTVAICPEALAVSIANPKARELSRCFAELFSANPELTLQLLSVAREKWNSGTVSDKARKYALTHLWHDRAKGIKMNDATIAEIQFAADPKLWRDASGTIKKVLRERLNLPPEQLYISEKLFASIKELRRLKLPVGWGM